MARRLVYAEDGTDQVTGQTVAEDTAMIRCCMPGSMTMKQAQAINSSSAASCVIFANGGYLTITMKRGGAWANSWVVRLQQGLTGVFYPRRQLQVICGQGLIAVDFGTDDNGESVTPTLNEIVAAIAAQQPELEATASNGSALARVTSNNFAGGEDDGDLVRMNDLKPSRCVRNEALS